VVKRKNIEDLLEDIIWQNAVQVYYLKVIAEGIADMTSPEQIATLTAKIDELQQTLTDEAAEIQAKIDELSTTGPSPELDAQIARLDGLNAAIEALVATTPPAEPV